MSKLTRKNIGKTIAYSLRGTVVGALLGWVFGSSLYGAIIGTLLFASIFLVLHIRFSIAIEVLTPYPERGPRPRTRVERAVEPFLAGIIGAQYGGLYFILGGENFVACLINGAVIFFIIDFIYVQYIDVRVVERGPTARR